MTNYASNYTPRVRIDYAVDGVGHSTLVRIPRDDLLDETVAADIVDRWAGFWTSVAGDPVVQDAGASAGAAVVGAAMAQQDEDLFVPFAPVLATISTEDNSTRDVAPIDRASLLSVTGRTVAGGRVALYFSGLRLKTFGVPSGYSDWRLDFTEWSAPVTQIGNKLQPSSINELGEILGGADGQPLAFMRMRFNARVSAKAIDRARS